MWRSGGWCGGRQQRHVDDTPESRHTIVLHNIASSTSNSMNRRPNGHRYTESTASIVAAANQTLEGVPLRPGATRSTSDSVLDSATGQSRRRTANVNRRSGGVFMYGSGNPVPGMLDHRATWGGNEHDDRHAWEQGYTFVGPSAAESSAQGRAGNRSSRFFDHPQRGATLSTSGSTLVGSTTGARELADAPMTDGSTGRSAQLHSPTANPVSHSPLSTANIRLHPRSATASCSPSNHSWMTRQSLREHPSTRPPRRAPSNLQRQANISSLLSVHSVPSIRSKASSLALRTVGRQRLKAAPLPALQRALRHRQRLRQQPPRSPNRTTVSSPTNCVASALAFSAKSPRVS